jgi:hypothetical protein
VLINFFQESIDAANTVSYDFSCGSALESLGEKSKDKDHVAGTAPANDSQNVAMDVQELNCE